MVVAFGRFVRGPSVSRLLRNRPAVLSLIVIAILIFIAVFGPTMAPQDPAAQDLLNSLKLPSRAHWLGTDRFGRDILSRLLYGDRVTLTAAAQGVGIAIVLGTTTGLIAGNASGLIDSLLSRINDSLLSLPPLILALAIVGALGPGLTNAMIAIGLVFSPRFFRVARGAALSVRSETYIEAARSVGCSAFRILWRHILPNASGPLLVQATFSAGIVITAEASLSFLGLGVQPPTASWGGMLHDAFFTMGRSSFSIYPPVALIVLTILAFSVLGDGLRDALSGSGGERTA